MARSDAITYGFAVGRVMVLRTRLLGRAAYERMLDAPTFADQRRVLSETHFGRFVEHVSTAADVERAVDESLRDLYVAFLEKAGLPDAVVTYFRTPYDFAALKGVLKASVLGTAPELPGLALGTMSTEAFLEPLALRGALGDVAREVAAADPALDAFAIDTTIDRAMFAEQLRLAHASGIEFLVRLARTEIDVANAKVLLRSAIAGRAPSVAREALIAGGSWDAAALAPLVARPEDLAEAVVAARVLGPAAAADLLDLARIDPLADAAVASLVREAVRAPVGPEPVLGYVLSRRAEAVTVRALLVGRLAGLPREVVAGRMREVTS